LLRNAPKTLPADQSCVNRHLSAAHDSFFKKLLVFQTSMQGKLIAVLFAGAACALCGEVAGRTGFELIYSPPSNANLGNLSALFEEKPGVFYVLGTWDSDTFGPAIFSLSSGVFQSRHRFPPHTQLVNVVPATDGRLYGRGHSHGSNRYFYYSIEPEGTENREYPLPEPWGSGWNITVTPTGDLYDLVGRVVDGA